MAPVRRLARVASWCALLAQAVLLCALPIAACCLPGAATDQAIMDCCREGAGDHICPLKPKPQGGDDGCRLRSGCAFGDQHQIGPLGVLALSEPAGVTTELQPVAVIVFGAHDPLDRRFPPPSPPPRV